MAIFNARGGKPLRCINKWQEEQQTGAMKLHGCGGKETPAIPTVQNPCYNVLDPAVCRRYIRGKESFNCNSSSSSSPRPPSRALDSRIRTESPVFRTVPHDICTALRCAALHSTAAMYDTGQTHESHGEDSS